MKLITRNTDYAIRALCFMAKNKDLCSVTLISNKLKIPKPFLRKILQILNNKGILSSFRGKEGGFKLAMPCNQIFITDLIKIFQGKVKLNECIINKKMCIEVRKCVLKRSLDGIEQYAIGQLQRLTIQSLL